MTMKKIEVQIEGVTPLLMHSPHGMIEETQNKLRKTTKTYDIVKDAEKVAYRGKNKELYIPARAIRGAMINASAWKKSGKHALRPILAAAMRIEPKEIGLGTKDYEIDLQTVVVQRSRIVRARPRLDNWKVSFTIIFNDELIPDPELIKLVLKEAGERVGLLDNRPACLGEYGVFNITKWKVEGDSK